MALGVKLKSSKKSTTMVNKRKPTNTTSTNKFKNKEEKDKTDDVKFHHMINKSDVKEGYELRKMRERVDLHRKKTLSERNFRKKPNSSNLGFNENDLQTVKKFHNRVYDKGTGENQRLGGRIDRQNKFFEGEFDFKNQNLRGRFDSKNANCKGEFDSRSENLRGRFDSKNEKIKRVDFKNENLRERFDSKNENLGGRFDSKNENLRRVDFKNENFRGRFDSKNENIRRVDFKNENSRRVDSKNENLRGRVDSKNENLKEENENQNSKLKFRRLPSRVLDKTGKKIRVSNKRELKKVPDEKNAQKKRKRVIKLDPCDGSNKRFDDIIPPPKEDIEKKDENEISKNAQFRAIIPSTSILSFVEENLLGRRRLIELTNAGYNVKISSPLDNVPFTTCKEREKIEEPVFRNKLEFFAAAKVSSSFPPPVIPEIAFAGRSNVGKSSLLNSLTRQWGVVRTSDKPGLTQTINFFRLASKLSLVDLPGYGFAYAKDEVKDAWEDLVKEYVSTRVGLQRVCLLIDTKWGMKPRDHELIDLMERSQTPYQIVLTKTDIVFPIDVARRAMQIQESLKKNKSVVNPLMMVSSKSGGGIRNLRSVLAKLGRFIKP